ncbi:MAG: sodium:solute symporter [Cytophagales bacterium]|nr:MAG: sodium:solute symporter [Cytophagales bacterium]
MSADLSPELILGILIAYFSVLILIAYFTSKGSTTDDFFVANKQSAWYLVAFGMIGASISGVTFISIPGAVGKAQFSYFQVVLGYVAGYVVIGTLLMPLYYRLNLVSIYSYLEQRFGFWSYKTGAFFFLLSRTIGAAFRIFLAVGVLQISIFDNFNIPFWLTAVISIFLIWVYTFRGGIKTIVWTDTLQTTFLLLAVVLSILLIQQELGLSLGGLASTIWESPYSKTFFWEDFNSPHFFFKQFFAGMFIAIAMTGLDQDLMQKNLTCKNIKEAQKNMFWFTVILVIVNLLFLSLGALLYLYAGAKGIAIPQKTDDLYPILALKYFSGWAGIVFFLGIIASTYASADSALASLTTSFCIDFVGVSNKEEKERAFWVRWVHVGFSVLLVVVILIFKVIQEQNPDSNVITSLFNAAGYTYGPLLGLYAFGLFTKYRVKDNWIPLVCVASPIFCYVLNLNSKEWLWGYQFGFEILILNGALTFVGMWFLRKKTDETLFTN